MKPLNERIVNCERCPRLREWCQRIAVEKRKSFADQEYWGRPVPNFGDPSATGLIVGLAPAAHGANRTGRLFTGDRSGDWLFRSLHKAGLCNQPTAVSADDGLELSKIMITPVVHCAPPDNKPTKEEILACQDYFLETLHGQPWCAVLCLGGIAWNETIRALGIQAPKFSHGVEFQHNQTLLLACYHPSQQNTFTGRLTEPMIDAMTLRLAQACC